MKFTRFFRKLYEMNLLTQDPEDRRRATEELWKAVKEGEDDRAVEAVVEAGADVRARDVGGWTPLHYAAMSGREAAVLSLISHGAELEAKGMSGWTPLHWAAGNGHLPCTKLLVERGADPNARASSGRTPLALAVLSKKHKVQQYLKSVGGTSLDIPSNDCTTCNGCRQAGIFLSWFDFCDQIEQDKLDNPTSWASKKHRETVSRGPKKKAKTTKPAVLKYKGHMINLAFLASLLSSAAGIRCKQVMVEGDQAIADALARRFSDSFLEQVFTLTTLQKPITLTILTKSLKMATSPYLNNALSDWVVCDGVLKALLDNWRSEDSDLAIETLRFFELLLEKGSGEVLDSLLLRFLGGRSYSGPSPTEENGNEVVMAEGRVEPDLSEIVARWTSVLPTEVQSCTCGYEEYVGESMRQYQAVLRKTGPPPPLPDSPPPSTGFVEGPFLSALLTALSNIPNQRYEVNLELTGIVSRLALRPEPALTEYLLTSSTGAFHERTLYSVLTAVGAELASSVSRLPSYQETLKDVRSELLGKTSPASEHQRNEEWISRFESIVVVEELCKELAAISHVKLKTSNT